MTRILSAAAFVAVSLALTPSVTSAQSNDGYYSATPVAAPSDESYVTRTLVWRCSEGECVAPKGTARDAIVCQLIAREVGVLSTFTAAGEAFDAEDMERCNARARS